MSLVRFQPGAPPLLLHEAEEPLHKHRQRCRDDRWVIPSGCGSTGEGAPACRLARELGVQDDLALFDGGHDRCCGRSIRHFEFGRSGSPQDARGGGEVFSAQ